MFNILVKRSLFPFILFFTLVIFLPLAFFINVNNIHKIYGQESKNISTENSDQWKTFSNSKFSFMYPEGWILEEKLSKFHVLDAKLIKDNPFSFMGISFSSILNSDKLSNDIILEQSEDFGKFTTKSGYSVYDILEKNSTKYTIDGNPSTSHIVKYEYKENKVDGKFLEIFSIIEDKLFTLVYQSTIQNFETDLPIIDKIIDSIKLAK